MVRLQRLVRRFMAHSPNSKIFGPLFYATAGLATVQVSAISALFAFSAVKQNRITTKNTRIAKSHSTCRTNTKLTDDEERASGVQYEAWGGPRSSSFGQALGSTF